MSPLRFEGSPNAFLSMVFLVGFWRGGLGWIIQVLGYAFGSSDLILCFSLTNEYVCCGCELFRALDVPVVVVAMNQMKWQKISMKTTLEPKLLEIILSFLWVSLYYIKQCHLKSRTLKISNIYLLKFVFNTFPRCGPDSFFLYNFHVYYIEAPNLNVWVIRGDKIIYFNFVFNIVSNQYVFIDRKKLHYSFTLLIGFFLLLFKKISYDLICCKSLSFVYNMRKLVQYYYIKQNFINVFFVSFHMCWCDPWYESKFG